MNKETILISFQGVDSKGMGCRIKAKNARPIQIDFGKPGLYTDSVNILTHHHIDHDAFKPENAMFGQYYTDKDIRITPIKIQHGTLPTFAYQIEIKNGKIFYMTDCKVYPKDVNLKDFDIIIIEANHSGYIQENKLQHPQSALEHLSHLEALEFLKVSNCNKKALIIGTHISRDNIDEQMGEDIIFAPYKATVVAKEDKVIKGDRENLSFIERK